MISDTVDESTWSLTNVKGMLLALVILWILTLAGIFGLGVTFRGHVQI